MYIHMYVHTYFVLFCVGFKLFFYLFVGVFFWGGGSAQLTYKTFAISDGRETYLLILCHRLPLKLHPEIIISTITNSHHI